MTARHGAFEPWWHVYDELDRARAADLGCQLGLDGRIDQPFGSLSAGERRRTSIARALMPDPDLLLLDEPTASLDLAARELLLRDLARLAQAPRPAAIVLVSHHLEEIPEGFEHALVLARGRALASGPVGDVLRDDVLSEAFGIPLAIEHLAGRWSARMRLDDTRTSSATGRMLRMTTQTVALPAGHPDSFRGRRWPVRPRPPLPLVSPSCWPGCCPARPRSSPPSARSSSTCSRRVPRTSWWPSSARTTSSPWSCSWPLSASPSGRVFGLIADAPALVRGRRIHRLRPRRLLSRPWGSDRESVDRRGADGRFCSGSASRACRGCWACWPRARLSLGRPLSDPARRSFLLRTGALGIGALRRRRRRSFAAGSGTGPVPAGAAASIPPASDLVAALPSGTDLASTTPGLTPIVVPNDEFYPDRYLAARPVARHRDVEAADPRPGRSRVRAHLGRARGPAHVRAVRDHRGVSNEVGGNLVGNAKWTGVRLRDVLEIAECNPPRRNSSAGPWTAGPPACRPPG
ncbi:MAG: ATP-binding cassette domain-containing protein [Candidatus Limnocylindrales bacterium]